MMQVQQQCRSPFLTCIDVRGQTALVKTLQEEPANSRAWPTTKHTSNYVIKAQERNSALGDQIG